MKVAKVALVGTGVIGASWATLFLAKGLDVIATDPAPNAEALLRETIARQWPAMETLGLSQGASQNRVTFSSSLEETVAAADFIQESGPERLEIKRNLYARMDAAARPEVILATSSSGILISEVQTACKRPERVLVGHPFNPPHLIPLVEVVGGKLTGQAAIDDAMAFYKAIGKRPIHIRKEVKGHVANRLQAALWREAFALVQDGVASVEDIDTAIAHGPGLRWALLGPFLNLHLSGGAGGLQHVMDHLGPPIESWWADMRSVTIDDDLKAKVVAGGDEELAGRSMAEITADRDRVLLALMRMKAEAEKLP
ncbi:MAG TPA: 3-hydroxyacyl-CoA dehydrogenase NAD-binding domain-containing protein [Alphaproteobacteria bacterium]|jgi:3-hydroxyacyl-CoA dehydrogenase|nr:3-hydroxyacyl-CoA dehydrogenase NAD-binding domain-containing protein [Alphaproteobacteria bacterium]